ncbi:monoacylglycerol O-acyltransferase 3 [Capsaspora owczarzaki ATCC 30864]|uniref:monoacylglycerol O-acyltransferase 3 n=1 Tax=Capsaspora owczarzaki (strain ATCC 30864) TaxID=595528 RepID=UPI0001FE4119|nr:monoacylglycerol O-acyltransferase 3 [Capsaspora owczarzaki ATCC 30864]|eukprot:XP_004345508.1 monoacylglycerol O-acyltransferase 3 [Capsaspora owczarzaki ATCC 30864]
MQISTPVALSARDKWFALAMYALLWFVAAPLSFVLVLLAWWVADLTGVLVLVLLYLPFRLDGASTRAAGRMSKWFTEHRVAKLWAAYFPMRLAVTAPLPVDKGQRYIMALYPHGTIPLHAQLALLFDGCDRSKLLPGLDLRVLSVSPNFLLPFWREIFLASGAVEASAHVATAVLESGRSVLVLPGGVAEMLKSRPGPAYGIIAKHRKGYVRLALEQGAALVPTFAFGANEFILQSRNKTLKAINTWIAKRAACFVPLYYGRWNTLVPFAHPVTVITGTPIPVERVASPTQAQVDALHQQFLAALRELFETHKSQFGTPNDELIFM